MAKFDKVKTNAEKLGKTEAEKSEKVVIENILIENLVADEENGEDVSVTEDIENSIKENGFIGSIVVTSFGMPDGKYRIISGHRRTEAMKKLNEKAIPCQIVDYKSEEEIVMARVSMNTATRDSEKNPLLFVQRWINFDNSIGGKLKANEKVQKFAEISGLSTSHIENRIKPMTRVIPEMRNLCLAEDMGGYEIGVSSISIYATLSEDEQRDVLENIIMVAISEGCLEKLTRPMLTAIKKMYLEGVRTWAEVLERTEEKTSHGENADRDSSDSEGDFDGMNPSEDENEEEEEEETSGADSEDDSDSDNDSNSEFDSEEIKEFKNGKKLAKDVDSLTTFLSRENYSFNNDAEGQNCIANMYSLVYELIVRAQEISEDIDNGFDILMMSKKELKEMLKDMES